MVAAPAAHVSASIFTDSTFSVGEAAVEPEAAFAAPVADAELLCSVPLISTRLFRCGESVAVSPCRR